MTQKILIVEDNPTEANYLGQFLLDENCLVDFVSSGYQAIKNIEANSYHLIFLNFNVPDSGGNVILAKIREYKSPDILPVILICSFSDLNELNEKILTEANDILTKPYLNKVVKTKIQNLLRLQNKTYELEQQIEENKQLIVRLEDANKKLTQSEAKFKMISDFSNDWEVYRDQNHMIIYCSPSIEKLLGYTAEEYSTIVSLSDFVHPDDFENVLSKFIMLTKGKFPTPVKYRLIKKSGEMIWVETSGQPIYTSGGEFIGLRTSSRDITPQKQIELALKESEEKYKQLFQFMDEGIVRTDNNGYIILANNALARMFGYNLPSDIIGEHITILYPAETREQMGKELKRVSQLYNFEIFTKTKQGKEMYLLCNIKENINENDEIIGREGIIRDITELKTVELALRKSEKNLKEANSTKDKFISILAHDLRTPFNALIGFSELLKEDLENYSEEEIKSFIDNIYDVSTRTFFFLNELLEWARAQRDMVAFNPENIHLIQIVNECISLISNVSKAKNIEIDCCVPPDLYVLSDRNMLKAILRNLISNAIKFTPKSGQVRVLASIKKSYLEIIVSDTGIGMDANTIQSLFQIDKTKSVKGTEGERGTGFGLLLCKEFVEKNGGTIWAESEFGKSSDFKFTIPIDTK